MKSGDRSRLLNVERLACGDAGRIVDEQHARDAFASGQRIGRRAAKLSRADDAHAPRHVVQYSSSSRWL